MSDDLVSRLRSSLPGIAQAECGGDNLAILLASFFEPGIESDELDDSGTWKQGAIDACDRVLDAIHAHYAQTITEARAEIERLRAVIDRVARVDNSLAKQLRASIENNAALVGELTTLRAHVREVVGPLSGGVMSTDEQRAIHQLLEAVEP